MAQKIKATSQWPFYQAYHDDKYINSHDCRKTVSLNDNKHPRIKYILNNDSNREIVVYRVDGGLIKSDEKNKCDFAIYTDDDTLFLIELKGSDLDWAARQINRTIELLIESKNIKPKMLCPRIVLSRVRTPDIETTQEKILKQRLKRCYGNFKSYKKQGQLLNDKI